MRLYFVSTSNKLSDGIEYVYSRDNPNCEGVVLFPNIEDAKDLAAFSKRDVYYIDAEVYGVPYDENIVEDNYFKSIEDILYDEGLNIPLTGTNFATAKRIKDLDIPVETVIIVIRDMIANYSKHRGKSKQGIRSLRYFEQAIIDTHEKVIKQKSTREKFNESRVALMVEKLEEKYREGID